MWQSHKQVWGDKVEKARALFHELWTKAVGMPDYDKEKWMELQQALTDLGIPM